MRWVHQYQQCLWSFNFMSFLYSTANDEYGAHTYSKLRIGERIGNGIHDSVAEYEFVQRIQGFDAAVQC